MDSESTADLDIVYITSPNEINDELRYSLRSLANLPHRRVWLVGYKPRWVTRVGYLPQYQRGSKHENTWANWLAAARHDEISDRFILFNDDFYATKPTGVPTLHRGQVDEVAEYYRRWRATFYHRRAVHTAALMRRAGLEARQPLVSYELHVPMVVNRADLLAAAAWLDTAGQRPGGIAKRTFYGNWAAIGGTFANDVKVHAADHGLPDSRLPFLSTSPQSWRGLAGGWLRRAFTEPSPYEVVPTGRYYRPQEASRVSR